MRLQTSWGGGGRDMESVRSRNEGRLHQYRFYVLKKAARQRNRTHDQCQSNGSFNYDTTIIEGVSPISNKT